MQPSFRHSSTGARVVDGQVSGGTERARSSKTVVFVLPCFLFLFFVYFFLPSVGWLGWLVGMGCLERLQLQLQLQLQGEWMWPRGK